MALGLQPLINSLGAIGWVARVKSFGKIRRSLIFRVLRAIAWQGREFLLLVALEPIDRGFLVRIRWAIVCKSLGGDRSGVCFEVGGWLAPAKSIATAQAEGQRGRSKLLGHLYAFLDLNCYDERY